MIRFRRSSAIWNLGEIHHHRRPMHSSNMLLGPHGFVLRSAWHAGLGLQPV
jgi:hypothetical protein